MAVRGLTYFEQHFFYSSELLRFLVDLRSQNQKEFRLQWIVFCTTIIYVCPSIVHQFYQLSRSQVSLQSAIKVLQNIIAALCILCIYSCYYFKSVKLHHSFVHIRVDYEKLFDNDELQILQMHERRSKIFVYSLIAIFHLYYIAMLSPCFFNICLHFFTRLENIQLKLPVPINDISNSGPVYYCFLIYQMIEIYILILIASVCYSTFLILLLHSFCQLSLISMKIGQPFRKYNKYERNALSNNKFHEEFKWIKDIINLHTRVIKFISYTNDYTKDIYLFQIFFAISLIVLDFLSIFQLLSVWQNKSELAESIIYITGSILITYMTFYAGQGLINHSAKVSEELCNVPFYTLSIKTQKLLLFVIARSMKPCYLSIGNLFVSSHEVFSRLMQKTFSFATVYYNVRYL